jgi:hypothetical protein
MLRHFVVEDQRFFSQDEETDDEHQYLIAGISEWR